MATKKTVKEEVVEAMEEQEVESSVPAPEAPAAPEAPETSIPQELLGPNGEELLFPGGPALAQVEEWKSRFKDEVYLTEFEEEVFLWRPITRKEYKQVMKVQNADSFYKEERICEACILYPQGYNFMAMTAGKAGIPTLLAELIMEKSGFQAKTGAMKL
jgi:hypothetical protein